MATESSTEASWSRSSGPNIGLGAGSVIVNWVSLTFSTCEMSVMPRVLKMNTGPVLVSRARWTV